MASIEIPEEFQWGVMPRALVAKTTWVVHRSKWHAYFADPFSGSLPLGVVPARLRAVQNGKRRFCVRRIDRTDLAYV